MSHATRFKPGERLVGRARGTPNKATADIRAAAQVFGKDAIEKLAALMNGKDEEIALKAANAILDRGYGKPAQTIAGDPENPLQHNVAAVDEFTRRIADMVSKAAG